MKIQRSPTTSGPGIAGGFGAGTDGVGVDVGVGVGVTVGVDEGVGVEVGVWVGVGVGVNVGVAAAKTFHDVEGPQARSVKAVAPSATTQSAAAAPSRSMRVPVKRVVTYLVRRTTPRSRSGLTA
jgi:hypothetical protein